jgi:hypothetical protein
MDNTAAAYKTDDHERALHATYKNGMISAYKHVLSLIAPPGGDIRQSFSKGYIRKDVAYRLWETEKSMVYDKHIYEARGEVPVTGYHHDGWNEKAIKYVRDAWGPFKSELTQETNQGV